MSALAQTARLLSPGQAARIVALVEWKGVAVALYPGVRLSLGMNVSGPDLKQLTVVQHSAGVTHGIQVLPDFGGYVLIRRGRDDHSDVFRVDEDLQERGSVRTSNVGDTSAIPSNGDAGELRAELLFWSMAADTLPLPPNAAQPAPERVASSGVSDRPVAAGSFAVQLGAFGAEAAARGRLRQVGPLPAGLSAEVDKPQGPGARFYRATVTGFATHEQGEAFCTARGIAPTSCWVRSTR
jgi:hypothetical protein